LKLDWNEEKPRKKLESDLILSQNKEKSSPVDIHRQSFCSPPSVAFQQKEDSRQKKDKRKVRMNDSFPLLCATFKGSRRKGSSTSISPCSDEDKLNLDDVSNRNVICNIFVFLPFSSLFKSEKNGITYDKFEMFFAIQNLVEVAVRN